MPLAERQRRDNKHKRIISTYQLIPFGGQDRIAKIDEFYNNLDPATGNLAFENVKYMAHEGDLFDILYHAHVRDSSHTTGRSMQEFLKQHYSNISRSICDLYHSLCPACAQKAKTVRKPEALTPILSDSDTFNSRGQIDLIDMQATPDGDNKWILQYIDHLTKFCYLRALTHNSKYIYSPYYPLAQP